jgi:sn-glycerol 3-phosphate transport system permease protein
MKIKRAHFTRARLTAYLLLAPQGVVLLLFVFLPGIEALVQAFSLSDPFGKGSEFVGFENFALVLSSAQYHNSIARTAIFVFFTTMLSMVTGLVLAVALDHIRRGRGAYRLLAIWPYAVAPVIAGALWLFMFHPRYGALAFTLNQVFGMNWNPLLDGTHAMVLIVVASAWKQVSYNFIFFLAGLQGIPKSLVEAAAIDGAGPLRRFATIVWPLLSPVTFFLVIVNLVYAFFDTFGVVHALTRGGPSGTTDLLVYKVYADGFLGQDLGASAAQSVILMTLVMVLTVVQFRFVERRVTYAS